MFRIYASRRPSDALSWRRHLSHGGAMRLLLHALGAAPRFRPLAAVAVASSEGWWEVEAQAFMREGRDWDAVCSAMRAAVTNEDTPLPGEARQPPLPGPLPPWTPPPERASMKDKTRRETWALCVAFLADTYVPGPLCCAYGPRVPASCGLYVPRAQGSSWCATASSAYRVVAPQVANYGPAYASFTNPNLHPHPRPRPSPNPNPHPNPNPNQVAYYGPAYASFTWQPEHPHETLIGRVQHAVWLGLGLGLGLGSSAACSMRYG